VERLAAKNISSIDCGRLEFGEQALNFDTGELVQRQQTHHQQPRTHPLRRISHGRTTMAPRSKTQNDGADEDVSMNETPVSHQPEVVEDASMVDAASEQGDLGSQFGEEETEEIQRVKLVCTSPADLWPFDLSPKPNGFARVA